MELTVPHMLHLFNIFHENKDSDNCAKVLEEECIKMFGTKSLNDEHDCNVVSMNPRHSYLLSILHSYHHLFTELVHLYNLPLYWVCWGHKRLFFIWLQGCLRETIFILRLPRIDKPYVIHLREICYCPTNLCTWRPNNVYKEKVA